MIEHSLSALYDIPHGAGLAVIMPAWLEFHATRNPHKLHAFGKRLFKIQSNNPETGAGLTIKALRIWLAKISCPTTLEQLDISVKEIPTIVVNAMGLAKLWRLREYTPAHIEKILRLSAG
jgi:alcohol dehydrogenase YqhD (iron-dependent ADH family)